LTLGSKIFQNRYGNEYTAFNFQGLTIEHFEKWRFFVSETANRFKQNVL